MIYIIQVLLYTVLAIQLSWAGDIPYEDVKLQIFDTQPKNFEKAISESLETTKNFLADEAVQQVIETGSAIVNFLPFDEAITTIVGAVTDLLKDGSEWKTIFGKTMEREHEISRELINNKIEKFTAKMNTMQKSLSLLDKSKNPGNQTRIIYAFSILQDISVMLNSFESRLGPLRKYPLVTAPLLINLALLTTVFTPLANDVIPTATKVLPIACNAYDILKLYRSLTVYARLEKTNMKYLRYREMMSAMNSIDKYGIKSKSLSCNRGCEKKTTYCEPSYDGVAICSRHKIFTDSCEKICIGLGYNDHSHCIKDEYGSDEFESSPYAVYDYTALVRSRVENLFPLKHLNDLCKRELYRPTGLGWVTIMVGVVSAFGTIDGGWCDKTKDDACDTLIRLYIDDNFMDVTSVVDDTYVYDAEYQFISTEIKRSSIIKIEVWDQDNNGEELVLRTEGSIDNFIENPYRSGDKLSSGLIHEHNSINTYVIWEDEFVSKLT